MASFMGGSAPAMARQIADGVTLVTAATLKRLTSQQLDMLDFELDKRIREARSEQPSLDDTQALQTRNRRIQRIQSARRVISGAQAMKRRKGV